MLVTAAYLGARQLVVQEAEAILDAPRACGQRLDGRRDVVHDLCMMVRRAGAA